MKTMGHNVWRSSSEWRSTWPGAPMRWRSVHLGDASPEVAAAGLAGMARGWPKGGAAPKGSTSMIVRLVYADGEQEDHPLVNGEHIADSIRRVDVPQSEFAFDLGGRQVRYLQIQPTRPEPLSAIEFIKGSDGTAPVVMAVPAEMP